MDITYKIVAQIDMNGNGNLDIQQVDVLSTNTHTILYFVGATQSVIQCQLSIKHMIGFASQLLGVGKECPAGFQPQPKLIGL